MTEHGHEPVRGLPGHLPPGERILWQGSPDWRMLARSAYHTRAIGLYFAALALVGAAAGQTPGAFATIIAGVACVGVLSLIAWATARATIYTITNRRVVIRSGLAVPTAINLPLKVIGAADLHRLGAGRGDIALTTSGDTKLAYWMLWPNARPWRINRPQPMLRAIEEVDSVVAVLTRAAAEATPIDRRGTAAEPAVASAPFATAAGQAA